MPPFTHAALIDAGMITLRYLQLCCLLLALAPAALAQNDGPATFTGLTMGPIEYRVLVDSDLARRDRDVFQAAIDEELENVNQLMSTYIADSEVSRFNQWERTEWFDVSPETALVVHRALEISEASHGAFDITVDPLVNLWNFGPDKSPVSLPEQEAIAAALARVGYNKISVNLHPPRLRKSKADVQIDLSAIAKGFAVDQVARRLEEMKQDSFLIEVGGEVITRGNKSNGAAWKVGVEKPLEGNRRVLRSIALTNRALASSGDYRNFYVLDGVRYSHTIDPTTGQPVKNNVAATSVIAEDCLTADAVATALMVLGHQHGIELAKELNVEALIIYRRGDELVEVQTDGFPGKPPADRAEQSVWGFFVGAMIVFLLAIVAMSVGVMFGRRSIRGSCGGIASLNDGAISPECSVCSAPTQECKELKRELEKRQSAS